jgi:1A family penicillin-binding protein
MKNKTLANLLLLVGGSGAIIVGLLFLWISLIQIPDLGAFDSRKIINSTKIYDRTGKVILYDIHEDIRRTEIPFDEMGTYIKNATVAIEDSEFYNHSGVRLISIMRALVVNVLQGSFSQGGSTITQQVVKNSVLTREKSITRKVKEWILSVKIDQTMKKEDILAIYLNEAPYGGNLYGIKEASRAYFDKEPKDLTLAEAAYLAAIPKAPTFYSPYGRNIEKLNNRKNLVLKRMLDVGFIGQEEHDSAASELVAFKPQEKTGIKAPHFVFFIKEYLEEKYGKEAVEYGGLKVVSTLNYELQEKAEEIVNRYAKENEVKFKGKNASLVSIDPKTGQILVMVGSRDYFDKEIDGNYNAATAKRQPGSAFKPFIYATAFKMGYRPETVVFDLPTEFQSTCDAYGKALPGYKQDECYMPSNYDDKYRGPMTLRDALAQSINVPAVKMLYLSGINNSIKTAKEMGIKTINDPGRYGLTLVLGGGEVTLLDMVSAYGGFATEGLRHPYKSILKIEDAQGNLLEEFSDTTEQVLPKNTALLINDVLSDNQARLPTFGENNSLQFAGRQVAAKTGTTNNYRDAWIVGYTPSIVTGAWAGNNDNTPMEKKTSGMIVAPMWHEFMEVALSGLPVEEFEKPLPEDNLEKIKPVIRGYWQGGDSFIVDKISGKLATANTPEEARQEKIITDVHTILYWVKKNDPMGDKPENPASDSQFSHWEIPIINWWNQNKYKYPIINPTDKPSLYDDIHTPESIPNIAIVEPNNSKVYGLNEVINIKLNINSKYPIKKADLFINGKYIETNKSNPFGFIFTPKELEDLMENNILRVVVQDSVLNSAQQEMVFQVKTD